MSDGVFAVSGIEKRKPKKKKHKQTKKVLGAPEIGAVNALELGGACQVTQLIQAFDPCTLGTDVWDEAQRVAGNAFNLHGDSAIDELRRIASCSPSAAAGSCDLPQALVFDLAAKLLETFAASRNR